MINDPAFAAYVATRLVAPLLVAAAVLAALAFGGGVILGWLL